MKLGAKTEIRSFEKYAAERSLVRRPRGARAAERCQYRATEAVKLIAKRRPKIRDRREGGAVDARLAANRKKMAWVSGVTVIQSVRRSATHASRCNSRRRGPEHPGNGDEYLQGAPPTFGRVTRRSKRTPRFASLTASGTSLKGAPSEIQTPRSKSQPDSITNTWAWSLGLGFGIY